LEIFYFQDSLVRNNGKAQKRKINIKAKANEVKESTQSFGSKLFDLRELAKVCCLQLLN